MRKLTDSKLQEICELLIETDITLVEISRRLNISKTTVQNIYSKRRYAKYTKDMTFKKRYSGKFDRKNSSVFTLDENKIKYACSLMEDENISSTNISIITGISTRSICMIRNGIIHKDISSKYNIKEYRRSRLMSNAESAEMDRMIKNGATSSEIINKLNLEKSAELYDMIRYHRKMCGK